MTLGVFATMHFLKHFHYPKKKSYAILEPLTSSPLLPSPSVIMGICLFGTFHIKMVFKLILNGHCG